MFFYFKKGGYPIDDFLTLVNIPKVFKNVVYWKEATFTFRMHARDKYDHYHELELPIDVNLEKLNISDIAHQLKLNFGLQTTHVEEEDMRIERMNVSFHFHFT